MALQNGIGDVLNTSDESDMSIEMGRGVEGNLYSPSAFEEQDDRGVGSSKETKNESQSGHRSLNEEYLWKVSQSGFNFERWPIIEYRWLAAANIVRLQNKL